MRQSMSSLVTDTRKRASRGRAHLIALAGVGMALLVCMTGGRKTVGQLGADQSQASQVVGELVASATIGQTFVAEYPGLSRVEVKLATYARRNSGPLIFHLRAAPNATEDVVTLTLDAAEIEDNAYHSFDFPPIRDSAGHTFYFYLETPEAEPDNAITAWGTTEDAYPDGKAVLRDVPGHGVHDLTFRLEYNPTWWQTIEIVLGLLADHKPSVWGNPWFYVLLGVSYLLLLYAFFVQVAQSAFSAGEDVAEAARPEVRPRSIRGFLGREKS